MDIILLAGLWLPRSIWAEVAAELERLGNRPLPVALPGVDDGSTTATLSDQVDAFLTVIEQTKRPVIVGHSAASNLAWIAADRRSEAVEKIIMIGGFPSADGESYADFFPVENGVMAFPGWAPFEGADADDLDQDDPQRIASVTVPSQKAFRKESSAWPTEDASTSRSCSFAPSSAPRTHEPGSNQGRCLSWLQLTTFPLSTSTRATGRWSASPPSWPE